MTTRREFLEIAAAAAAIAPGGWPRAFAQQQLSQADLLRFDELGNVTLVHIADLHAQLVPVYFREAAVNIGVGEARGQAPHVTGAALLARYGIPPASPAAYALSPDDFTALAKAYGRMGGLDRIATVLEAIRAERGEKVVFLDGGDTWQNSYTSLVTKGQDMVDCMAMLRPDAMVGPEREFPMPHHGVGAEHGHAIDHVLPLGDERRVAVLPGIAAIEENDLFAALCPDCFEHRRDAVEPAHPAISLRERGEVVGRKRVSRRRRWRNAVTLEQRRAGHMRHLPPCLADPDIDRRFAEIDRHQLRMEVGDVDERDVAKPVETQQVGLAQLLLSKGAGPAARHDRGRSGGDCKKLAPRRQFRTAGVSTGSPVP